MTADLLAVLREAREVLMLSDPDFRERDLTHPARGFDAAVRALCEAHGYGAVMQSASNQWRLKDSVGAHTRGACVLTVQQTIARIDSALSAHEAQGWMPIAEAPKDGRLIATWNPRQPSISRFLRWGTPNLSKDRAWITPKGCAPTYLPTQFLILPPPPEPQK